MQLLDELAGSVRPPDYREQAARGKREEVSAVCARVSSKATTLSVVQGANSVDSSNPDGSTRTSTTALPEARLEIPAPCAKACGVAVSPGARMPSAVFARWLSNWKSRGHVRAAEAANRCLCTITALRRQQAVGIRPAPKTDEGARGFGVAQPCRLLPEISDGSQRSVAVGDLWDVRKHR